MSEKKPVDKKIWIIILILCVIGAIIAVVSLVVGGMNRRRAEEEMALLAEQVNAQTTEPEETSRTASEVEEEPELTLEERIVQLEEELDITIPRKELDFDQLHEETNEDIYAWIYIPDTVIDYPVVQHPTDNAYYLNHNLNGSQGLPGTIYSEDYNSRDFTDVNTVLYGHNMKAGTMFAQLHNYEDRAFFDEQPYVFIYTEDDVYIYEIFAAHESGSEHILLNYSFDNKVMFQGYLDDIINKRSMNCNIREESEVDSDSHILTLSTCVSNRQSSRYLVQCVLLNPEDLPAGEDSL